MRFQQHPTYGFTTKANGLARELKNDIYISEIHDHSTGLPEPVKKPYKAIWDTGATNTCITPRVVQELGLQPSGRAVVQVVGSGAAAGEHEVATYLVNIFLPNQTEIIGVRVSENTISGGDVLIGMDIITHGDFAITNYNGQTWWTFRVPSNEPIDFVEEIREHNRQHGQAGGQHPPAWLAKAAKKKGMQKKKKWR